MLLTRAPLYRGRSPFSLDLHVLGAPLTFVLSQDQTLQLNPVAIEGTLDSRCHSSAFAGQISRSHLPPCSCSHLPVRALARLLPMQRRIYCIRETHGLGCRFRCRELQLPKGKSGHTSTLNCSLLCLAREASVTLSPRGSEPDASGQGPAISIAGIGLSFQGPRRALLPSEGAWKLGVGASLVKHEFKIISGSFWCLFRPNTAEQVCTRGGRWSEGAEPRGLRFRGRRALSAGGFSLKSRLKGQVCPVRSLISSSLET